MPLVKRIESFKIKDLENNLINKHMTYRYKYKPQPMANPKKPRKVNPNSWITGPNELRHEKYYAYLKHRAQCNYRQEFYTLTWEDWESLWDDELFLKRGRRGVDLCLSRIDFNLPWSLNNVVITSRREHLKRNGEFRSSGKSVR